MSGKLIIASFTLLAASAAYGSPSDMKANGEWTRKTRQVGRVAIDVYHRTPYALTGSMASEPARRSSGELTRETRQLGNKVTIDVYRR
jgi:hypothetical protein